MTNKSQASTNDFVVDKTNPNYESIFKSTAFDFVINASGSMSVEFSMNHLMDDFNYNAVNTFRLLDAIRNFNPTAKFIHLSSAAVYGNPQVLPIGENTTTNPISPYGFHKELSEKICSEFSKLYNIKCLSLRIFSVYGPDLKKQLLWDISNKINESKNSEIELFGTGNESRDYIYIDDLMIAIDLIVMKGDFAASIYNVANGEEVKIKDIASKLVSLLNPSVKINFNGKIKAGDPVTWKADISKLNQLGYAPQTKLEDGVKNYVQWLKK